MLSEEKWINQLKLLTDIEDISSDNINHNNLSNYHVMTKSGFLGSHVDTSFNFKYLHSLVNYDFNKFLKRFSPNF